MATTIAKKVINEELNGVELYFSVFPLSGTKDTLKKNGFRWNHKKACWYAKRSVMTDEIATICAETTIGEYKTTALGTGEEVKAIEQMETKAKKSQKASSNKNTVNKFGVKVGDYFSMSWGYEQTNNNYFQVVALVGTSSVRIREVNPEIIEREGVGPMAENRTYKLDTTKLLAPASYSCFIKDQENGDLKRLKSYRQDGTHPQINMTSYADAYYCDSPTEKTYESWYA